MSAKERVAEMADSYRRGALTKPMPKDKIHKVMGEFKRGKLHSGSKKGPKVENRKQAIAIAMSEAGKSRNMRYHGHDR